MATDSKPYAPLFLQQTYAMVSDPTTEHIIAWSGPDSFIIKDQNLLASDVLPKYFKHNNFSSFVRQLNGYGFRKVSPDSWNFKHEKFVRGQPQLLREMSRRKAPKHGGDQSPPQSGMQSGALVPLGASLMGGNDGQTGEYGLEFDSMRKGQQYLMEEILRLRQEQESSKRDLESSMNKLAAMAEQNRAQISGLLSLLQAAVTQPRRGSGLPAPSGSSASLRLGEDIPNINPSKRPLAHFLDTPSHSTASLTALPLPATPTPTAAAAAVQTPSSAARAPAPKRVSMRTPVSPEPVVQSPAPSTDKRKPDQLRMLADAATVDEAAQAQRRSSSVMRRRTQSASALLEDGKEAGAAVVSSPGTFSNRPLPSPAPGTPLLVGTPPAFPPMNLDGGADLFGMYPGATGVGMTPLQGSMMSPAPGTEDTQQPAADAARFALPNLPSGFM